MDDPREPGGFELQRSIDALREEIRTLGTGMNQRLDKLVTTEVHELAQRRVDERLKDVADDIAAERSARSEEMAAEKAARKELENRVQQQMDRTSMWVRWLAASILVPIALFIANIYLNGGPS